MKNTELNKCRTCGQKLSLPDSIEQGLCTYHNDPMITLLRSIKDDARFERVVDLARRSRK